MKTKKINVDVLSFGNIVDLKETYHIQDSMLIDYCIADNLYIYLLFSQIPPDRIDDMYVNVIANAHYYVIKIMVNWKEKKIEKQSFYDLKEMVQNYHYIRPLGENFLLIGARCVYIDNNNYQKNARIVDRYGTLLREFCLGDGIENVLITHDNKIIVSYFDEGIFGNYGWTHPLGSHGLVIWDKFGHKLWENENFDISDCYGLNIDELKRVWFYYYTDFRLVCLDKHENLVFEPHISGANIFSISHNRLFMDGGYDERESFYCFDIDFQQQKLLNKQKIALYYQSKRIYPLSCFCFSHYALFVGLDNCLYGYCFDGI